MPVKLKASTKRGHVRVIRCHELGETILEAQQRICYAADLLGIRDARDTMGLSSGRMKCGAKPFLNSLRRAAVAGLGSYNSMQNNRQNRIFKRKAKNTKITKSR